MALAAASSPIYPLYICPLSQSMTKEGLEQDIKHELEQNHNRHCDYQCIAVIGKEALLLAKTERDQHFLKDNLKTMPFIPAEHLIHEFKRKYFLRFHQDLHLMYNLHPHSPLKQQIEGAQNHSDDDSHYQREGGCTQYDEQQQKGNEEQQKPNIESYPLLDHPIEEHNDGVYDEFDNKGVSHEFIQNGEEIDIEIELNGNEEKLQYEQEEKYSPDEDKNPNHIDVSLIGEYLYEKDDYYDAKVYLGICTSKEKGNDCFIGSIRSYPYFEIAPQGLTIYYHSAFFDEASDVYEFEVGTALNFSIGINKKNNRYIAYDICISSMGLRAPSSCDSQVERECIGQIIVSIQGSVWVKNISTRRTSQIITNDYHKYGVKQYIRYNEIKKVNEYGEEELFCTDDISIGDHSKSITYELGGTLSVNAALNDKYRFIHVPTSVNDDYLDIFIIIQTAEMYINAFLNSGKGGIVYFGVGNEGRIIAITGLNSDRKEFIRMELAERVKRFVPSVPSTYYGIRFRQLMNNGFEVPKAFVIILTVAKVQQKKRYYTQQQIYYQKPEVAFNCDVHHQAIMKQCDPIAECWEWKAS